MMLGPSLGIKNESSIPTLDIYPLYGKVKCFFFILDVYNQP